MLLICCGNSCLYKYASLFKIFASLESTAAKREMIARTLSSHCTFHKKQEAVYQLIESTLLSAHLDLDMGWGS